MKAFLHLMLDVGLGLRWVRSAFPAIVPSTPKVPDGGDVGSEGGTDGGSDGGSDGVSDKGGEGGSEEVSDRGVVGWLGTPFFVFGSSSGGSSGSSSKDSCSIPSSIICSIAPTTSALRFAGAKRLGTVTFPGAPYAKDCFTGIAGRSWRNRVAVLEGVNPRISGVASRGLDAVLRVALFLGGIFNSLG